MTTFSFERTPEIAGSPERRPGGGSHVRPAGTQKSPFPRRRPACRRADAVARSHLGRADRKRAARAAHQPDSGRRRECRGCRHRRSRRTGPAADAALGPPSRGGRHVSPQLAADRRFAPPPSPQRAARLGVGQAVRQQVHGLGRFRLGLLHARHRRAGPAWGIYVTGALERPFVPGQSARSRRHLPRSRREVHRTGGGDCQFGARGSTGTSGRNRGCGSFSLRRSWPPRGRPRYGPAWSRANAT